MPSPNNVLTADSYVQDGLVFQLDGIDYGGIDGRWDSRKNDASFNVSADGISYQGNSFRFDGSVSAPIIQGSARFPYDNHSIECCLNIGSPYYHWPSVLSTNISSLNIAISAYYTQRYWSIGFNQNCPIYQIPSGKITLNAFVGINKRVIANAILCALSEHSITIRPSNIDRLAASSPNYNQLFKGSIYAIRIYSRQLSDREILINQKIDNARFQLGLNIPDEVLPATRSLSLSEPFELPDESMTEQEITNENSDER